MQITIDKEKALAILQKNRDTHIVDFAGQIQGWKVAMDQYGKDLAAWSNVQSEDIFDKTKSGDRPTEPYKPQDYVDSYDRLIELITANVTDTVSISEREFDQIIKNEFSWTGVFNSNSATYNMGSPPLPKK